ncbi:hypothetical protein H8356DRAFT_1315011 [Neocallimastix lanati (nom. inval.)]|jgi:hypothetical protein|uniref:Uncharacterized protein n=1 Tax=Neocallimastix californiae TaxID=1754190 RepID=A0A1Y2CT25_9FUNG|nr:hypothetical protein H8356DRAFT_1315011 [Neocallimastix sp. JGI-2020a]ORY50171.1 hypothetical protein LY90DRAFT_670800 [Neocallimastix californiae]|eukprot:ORY50171.1 hypothetical protein LY90DRAFT_670800 [Neocallimastix californiae]
MAKKTEVDNNDDYEFRIVSSTLSPLTNEESLNLLSLIQPYLNITKIKNTYKKLQSRTFTCSFNIQSNFELQRAIYGQYDIIHISKNCCALHFYFTSPKYAVEKICFYLFRCSISLLSAYLINKKLKGLLLDTNDKLNTGNVLNKKNTIFSTTIKNIINFKDTINDTKALSTQSLSAPSTQNNLSSPNSYNIILKSITQNSTQIKDFMLKFIPFYLSYKLTVLSKFGFFLWNNYPVNYIPIVVENNDMDGNSVNNSLSSETYRSIKSDNKELFLVNKNTLAKEVGFWAFLKKLFL